MSRLPVLIFDESTEASDESRRWMISLTAHFQGEHRRRRLGGNMRCDVERERALSHSGGAAITIRLAGWRPAKQLVDRLNPGLGAGDVTTRRTRVPRCAQGRH